jgi:hypothetical protein
MNGRTLLTLALVLVLAGCGTRSAAEGSAPRRQANTITADEILQEARTQNAFELIRALRPNWLQSRGAQSLGQPSAAGAATGAQIQSVMVYIDGTRLGPPQMLQQILARDVAEARFLSPTEAFARFGSDHAAGAILITTRR